MMNVTEMTNEAIYKELKEQQEIEHIHNIMLNVVDTNRNKRLKTHVTTQKY